MLVENGLAALERRRAFPAVRLANISRRLSVADEAWHRQLDVERARMSQTWLPLSRFYARSFVMAIAGFPDENNVLEACGRLVDFNAWEPTKIDPEGWRDH